MRCSIGAEFRTRCQCLPRTGLALPHLLAQFASMSVRILSVSVWSLRKVARCVIGSAGPARGAGWGRGGSLLRTAAQEIQGLPTRVTARWPLAEIRRLQSARRPGTKIQCFDSSAETSGALAADRAQEHTEIQRLDSARRPHHASAAPCRQGDGEGAQNIDSRCAGSATSRS